MPANDTIPRVHLDNTKQPTLAQCNQVKSPRYTKDKDVIDADEDIPLSQPRPAEAECDLQHG
eukprot:10744676-Lingulodinium_polyedra.AAC.1